MRAPRRPPRFFRRRSRPVCRHGLSYFAVLLLCGCAINGDFGRLRPELVNDNIHDWVGHEAVGGIGGPVSEYPLTDDERALRDLAYPLIAPPYDRVRWDSLWREYGVSHRPPLEGAPLDPSAYWHKLTDVARRSEASAYAQVVTDSRNDVVRLEPFFALAGRVIDMDRKRALSLSHVAGLTGSEAANALNRNKENTAIVAWVCRSLKARADAYRFALERLVITVPSGGAAEAERAHTMLVMRINQYCQGGSIPAGGRGTPAGGLVSKG
jgi:hypothetical protein